MTHAEPSFFANSLNTTIGTGTFVAAQRDVHIHSGSSHRRGLELLRENVAIGAFHDAAERGDPPKCHPKTRSAILDKIMGWIKSPSMRERFILWLNGPAGAGKSAIAQSIAEMCAKEGLLAACFFFSRAASERNTSSFLIATISYQLSVSIPELRDFIGLAVEQDPTIFKRTLAAQMQALILGPVKEAVAAGKLLNGMGRLPGLVIMDGLDECGEESSQRDILQVLASSISQLQQIPLIFLVASRPEYTIRTGFNQRAMSSVMFGMALDENYKPDDDIALYLQDMFDALRDTHPSGSSFVHPWPTEAQLSFLVEKASGQFIYASTVTKYINSPRHSPPKRLNIILGLSNPGNDAPFSQLDALYSYILSSVQDFPKVLDILTLLILHKINNSDLNLTLIEDLFGYEAGEARTALLDMHALLRIPDGPDRTSVLTIYHASLHDFLMDKSRSGSYFIDAQQGHTKLAMRWAKLLVDEPTRLRWTFAWRHLMAAVAFHSEAGVITDELSALLTSFNLPLFLSEIRLSTFYSAPWSPFLKCIKEVVRIQGLSRNDAFLISLFHRPQVSSAHKETCKDQIASWIKTRMDKYPEPLRSSIPTSLCLSSHAMVYVPDIFVMLLHSMNLSISEFNRIRQLDKDIFGFQDLSNNAFHGMTDKVIMVKIFLDPARAGPYLVNHDKFTLLAVQIVEFLCKRSSIQMAEALNNSARYLTSDADPTAICRLRYTSFEYFDALLTKSSNDAKLAALLEQNIVDWKAHDSPILQGSRAHMADSSRAYIYRYHKFRDVNAGLQNKLLLPRPIPAQGSSTTKQMQISRQSSSSQGHSMTSLFSLPTGQSARPAEQGQGPDSPITSAAPPPPKQKSSLWRKIFRIRRKQR